MIGGSGEREHDQNQREPGSQDPQSHHLVKLVSPILTQTIMYPYCSFKT